MCGRYTTISIQAIAEQFGLPLPDLRPSYNIGPERPILVVRRAEGSGQREIASLRWGLIPWWTRDAAMLSPLINARAETAAWRPAFRDSFRQRRCLIPADGFYEWKGEAGRKQPYFVQMRDGRLFAFAGLWDRWEPPDGDAIESCTILTTNANDLVRPLHDRMPVIVRPEDYELWLEPGTPMAEVKEILRPYPVEEMRAYPVSRDVNSMANDRPELIRPLGDVAEQEAQSQGRLF